MLILTRREGESIFISLPGSDETVEVRIMKSGAQVSLGIDAPREAAVGVSRLAPAGCAERTSALCQKDALCSPGSRLFASDPTSAPFALQCNRSAFGISSATSSSTIKRIECCVDRLRSQSTAVIHMPDSKCPLILRGCHPPVRGATLGILSRNRLKIYLNINILSIYR